MGLGVCVKNQSTGWKRYIKCEKLDHNVVRMVSMINFYSGINIKMDFGKQVQAIHITGQCSEAPETSDGQTIACKSDLEDFAWNQFLSTLAIYWVENGLWYYLQGAITGVNFDHDPANDSWWNFRLDLQGANSTSATGKQLAPGGP